MLKKLASGNANHAVSRHDPRDGRWNLLASHDDGLATLWAHWRRERQIRKAVAALAQFDERSLRDMGISGRSEIEQVVRYCHDC